MRRPFTSATRSAYAVDCATGEIGKRTKTRAARHASQIAGPFAWVALGVLMILSVLDRFLFTLDIDEHLQHAAPRGCLQRVEAARKIVSLRNHRQHADAVRSECLERAIER